MTPSTRESENVRTLEAFLGLDENDALSLLESSVQITWLTGDVAGSRVGFEAAAMLARTFTIVGTPDEPQPSASVELRINGAGPMTAASSQVFCDVSDAGARIFEQPAEMTAVSGDLHPLLCLLVGCYAAARVTQNVFQTYGFSPNPDAIELPFSEILPQGHAALSDTVDGGVCHQIGAGAVGNAFLYALRYANVTGTFIVIDPKLVTSGVLNRCMWFTNADLTYPKAERLVEHLRTAGATFEVQSFVGTLAAYRKSHSDEIERMIVAVDSRRARRTLQADIPREVFDASTTGIDEIVLHFNRQPLEHACLACIYKHTGEEASHDSHVARLLGVSVGDVHEAFISEIAADRILAKYPELRREQVAGKAYDTLYKALCSAQLLRTTEDKQVLAPFAFVSMLAGAWLALEFLQRCRRGGDEPKCFNYWRAGTWRSPNFDLRSIRPSLPDCPVCSQPMFKRLADQIWGASIYDK